MTGTEFAAIFVPIIAVIGGVLTSIITIRAGRKKNAAEATETLTDIAMGLVTPMREQIAGLQIELQSLEETVDALKKENALLHRWAQLLFTQVVEAGHEPYSFEFVRRMSKE